MLSFALPAILWISLYFARPLFYHPWCAVEPSPCLYSTINAIDQIAFHYRNIMGDFYSNVLQNTVGAVAVLLPWLFRPSRPFALSENKLLLVVTLWNGVCLEIVRLLVQRPRPMVYDLPLIEGANIQQYTSFYSGHTSFVALATLSTFFMFQKFNHRAVTLFSFVGFLFLTALTGWLRVYGGRHFPTDVLCGAVIGSALAYLIRQRFTRFQFMRANKV